MSDLPMLTQTTWTESSLDEIGIKHQTDKASVFTRTYARPHDYLRHLERFFEPLRDEVIDLIEVGVGGGESIRTWLEYFPKALVFGIDNVHSTNPWNTALSNVEARYQFVIGDQSDPEFWKQFTTKHGDQWDVFIDDGGHYSNQIITTFNAMWTHIAPGGLYIIEDLGVSYGAGSIFCPSGWPNHMDWLRSHLDAMNCGNPEIDSMYFAQELAIIRKK